MRCTVWSPSLRRLVPQDSTQPPDVWVPLPTPLLRISPRSFSPPRALCRGRPFLPLTDLAPQKHPQPWLRPVRRASLGRRGTVALAEVARQEGATEQPFRPRGCARGWLEVPRPEEPAAGAGAAASRGWRSSAAEKVLPFPGPRLPQSQRPRCRVWAGERGQVRSGPGDQALPPLLLLLLLDALPGSDPPAP